MGWYVCQRCGEVVPEVVLDMCTKCLTELESLRNGDQVSYRHGRGWAVGTFVKRTRVGSYEILSSRGKTLVRPGQSLYKGDVRRH